MRMPKIIIYQREDNFWKKEKRQPEPYTEKRRKGS